MAQFHNVVKKIKDLLEQNDCWFEMFEHKPVRTSEEAAKLRPDYFLSQGAKAMIVKAKNKGKVKFVMIVVPGDKRFDSKKTKKLLGTKDLSFASEKKVKEITEGVEPGGVPPFGDLFGLEVYVDKALFDNEKIVFNAGDRSVSIAIRSEDYKELANPEIVEII